MQEKYKSMSNVPNLRFPEFSGEWEVKKLGETAIINPSNRSLPEKFIYIDLESVVNGELIKENEIELSEAPSRAQRILKEDDVLFQTVRPYQMNNLFFNKNGNYVASTGYAQIRTMQNSMFVFQYLHYQKFVDKVIERCTGTSYPAINSTDLSNIRISFPTLLEQKKIASFLSLIDERIQTQSKIIKNLKTLIKATIEKLFTQKIKFKDENGNDFPNWENKLGGEVFESISNKKHNSDLPILAITQEYGAIPRDLIEYQISVTDKSVESYKVVEIGDFIISLRSFQGGIEYSNYKGICSPAYIILRNKIKIDNRFYKYYLKADSYIKLLNKKLEGIRDGKMISYAYFSEINLPFPCIEEQAKIATFLSQIDKKIEIENRLLAQYENQKKYLLQNLFI